MSLNRYSRRLLKRIKIIWHKIDWILWLATLGLGYFLITHGEVPYVDLFKAGVFIVFILIGGFILLGHFMRRRLSNGFVGSGSEPKVLSMELEDCKGAYLFVGNSFKPHLDIFLSKYRPDGYGKKQVFLVLASAEHNAELGKEHLEVMEALKAFKIEFRTLKHPRLWWAHVFNNEDENEVSILFGLNVLDGKVPSTVLQLEKVGKRYSFFEHFLSQAREAYSLSDIQDVDIWSRDLKRLMSRENN